MLGADGSGSVSTVIRAIEYCIANRERLAIRVINLSLGRPSSDPYRNDPLAMAVERAVRAGIVVVGDNGRCGDRLHEIPLAAAGSDLIQKARLVELRYLCKSPRG